MNQQPGTGPLDEDLTLRDLFATFALPEIIRYGIDCEWSKIAIARESYKLADAMLAARKERTE